MHSRLKISYLQAALGAEIEFETISGARRVEVDPGTYDGDTVRVKSEGLPSLRGTHRGELVLHVKVEFPKKLSKKEEELLREIAKEKGVEVQGHSGIFGRKK